jgi:MFS family permease
VAPALDRGRIGRGMRDALGNGALRRLLGYRLVLAAVAAFDPFLVVFGLTHIGLDVHLIGMALLAWVVGQVLGSWFWPWLIARTGERLVFQLASFCRLLLLVWIVAMPSLVETNAFTSRFDGARDGVMAFTIGFVFLGLASAAGAAANASYLMRVTSTSGLHGSTLVTNLGAVIGGLFPLGAAWLLDRYDDERVFWVAIGLGVVSLLASGLLVDTGARVRGRSRAWRQQSRPRAA